MNAAETAATSMAFESVANENENTTDLYCVIVLCYCTNSCMESEVYAPQPRTHALFLSTGGYQYHSVSPSRCHTIGHPVHNVSLMPLYMVISPNKERPVSQSLIGGLLAFLQLINLVNGCEMNHNYHHQLHSHYYHHHHLYHIYRYHHHHHQVDGGGLCCNPRVSIRNKRK